MKKTFLFAVVVLFAVGCNNKSDAPAGTADSAKATASTTEELNYPYQLEKPYQNWQMGDQKHAVTAMASLKAFENGDINACMAGFGDSVEVRFDYFQAKFSKDSLTKFFTADRAKYSNIKITMGDWESVISKDGKTEWVAMWYKQVMTDKKGKTDSLAVIDDCRIVNGKIVEVFMNTLEHVYREVENYQLHFYVNFGEKFNGIHWRKMSPQTLLQVTESLLHSQTKAVYY